MLIMKAQPESKVVNQLFRLKVGKNLRFSVCMERLDMLYSFPEGYEQEKAFRQEMAYFIFALKKQIKSLKQLLVNRGKDIPEATEPLQSYMLSMDTALSQLFFKVLVCFDDMMLLAEHCQSGGILKWRQFNLRTKGMNKKLSKIMQSLALINFTELYIANLQEN